MTDTQSAYIPPAPARETARGAAYATAVLFLCLCVPSFLLSLPGLPEFVRTTDLIAALLLFTYFLGGGRAVEGERYLLLFLVFLMLVSVAALLVMGLNAKLSRQIDSRSVLYPIRAVFIYAPALAAFHINLSPQKFARHGYRWMMAGVLFTLAVSLAHMAGSTSFYAHQTLEMGTIRNWTTRVHRLGGIVGESGAFAFHAVLVFQLLIFFAFMSERTRLGRRLLTLFTPYLLFVFYLSQTRIVLLTGLIFVTLMLFNRLIVPRRTAILIALSAFGSVVLGAFWLITSRLTLQMLDLGSSVMLLRFQGFFTGESGESLSSSGRVNHWREVSEYILMNPLFGYGQRTVSQILNHAVENFFLQNLVDYGIIGLLLYFLVLRWLWRSMDASNLPASPSRDTLRIGAAVLKAIMIASFVQWQVNDINTYFQAFPMLAVSAVLFARQMNAARARGPC